MNRTVAIVARERDINSRGRGSDTYAMVALPGASSLIWADEVDGATIAHDDYPRSRGFRAAERRGKKIVRVDLPVGAAIVFIEKRTDGPTDRTAVKVTAEGGDLTTDGAAVRASTLPGAEVQSRRRGGGWVTVVDGVEYA